MLLKRFELLLFHHRARHAKQIVKMDKSLACRSRFVEGGGPEAPRWPPAKEWSLYTEIMYMGVRHSVQGGTSHCTGGYVTMYRGVRQHVQGGTSQSR